MIPQFQKIINKTFGVGNRHCDLQQIAGLKLFVSIFLDSHVFFIQNFPNTMLLHFLGLVFVIRST